LDNQNVRILKNLPSSVSLKGKRTTTKAIRIPGSIDQVLQLEAKNRNISVNGLVTSILTKFAEWDRYAERFGFVTIPNQILKKLVTVADESTIAQVASELGPELLGSEVTFWYKQATLESFIEWFSTFTRYSGLHKTEITRTDGEYVIVLKHELDRNWSIFLKYYFDTAFKARLGITLETEIDQYQVLPRLPSTSPKSPARTSP